ncbi:MAG: hypothetical protein ACTHM7_11005 [Ginsengibacter sp.]
MKRQVFRNNFRLFLCFTAHGTMETSHLVGKEAGMINILFGGSS